MELNEKKLVQLRTKLNFYKKLENKIEKVLNAELDIEDWRDEVCDKVFAIEDDLDSLKLEMDLSDERYHEDEPWAENAP